MDKLANLFWKALLILLWFDQIILDSEYQTCKKLYYAEIKFDMDKSFYYLLKCFSSTEVRYQMKNVSLHNFFYIFSVLLFAYVSNLKKY